MKCTLIGAAVVAAAAFATPALAQPVISNPGYCAQFYPNANCQNLGPGNPYTDGGYYRGDNGQNGYAMMAPHVRHHTHRHHTAK
jgi:opacity protein-like surface antigen